jgi:gas vesicle protein
MSKKAGKVALGLGLLTGAITGMLFAPEEGKKIRSKIAKGDTKGLLDSLRGMGDDMRDVATDIINRPSVQELLEKAKDKAADVAQMERKNLDELMKKANQKAETFKKQVSQYVNEQKKALDAHMPKAKKAAKKVAKKMEKMEKMAIKKIMPKKAATKKAAKPAMKKATVKKAAPKKKGKN